MQLCQELSKASLNALYTRGTGKDGRCQGTGDPRILNVQWEATKGRGKAGHPWQAWEQSQGPTETCRPDPRGRAGRAGRSQGRGASSGALAGALKRTLAASKERRGRTRGGQNQVRRPTASQEPAQRQPCVCACVRGRAAEVTGGLGTASGQLRRRLGPPRRGNDRTGFSQGASASQPGFAHR